MRWCKIDTFSEDNEKFRAVVNMYYTLVLHTVWEILWLPQDQLAFHE